MKATEEQKEYQAEYRAKHKYESQHYQAKYQIEHKAELKEYQAKYQANHKSEVSDYQAKYLEDTQNNCVYMLEINSHIYIGSTAWFLRRIISHKQDAIHYPDRLLYKYINENGGWQNVKKTILMEEIPFIELARKIEERYIGMIPEELSLNTYKIVKVKSA